jgi:FdhD protein
MKPANMPIQFHQISPNRWETVHAEVIVETPVSLTVNGEVWLTFMCTPVELEAMSVGFLFNEGLISAKDEIVQARLCAAGDNVDVWLNHSLEKPAQWRRTSGCTGGVTSVEETLRAPVVANGATLTPAQIGQLIQQLFEAQLLYRASGGVHTSALSDGERLVVVAEDIGRHNTLDKIAGRCLMDNIYLPRRILLTTGRISSEMLQKSARLNAAIVISRTSPSSLSIELAEAYGITLIGYARRDRFNVYTHPARIVSADETILAAEKPIFT